MSNLSPKYGLLAKAYRWRHLYQKLMRPLLAIPRSAKKFLSAKSLISQKFLSAICYEMSYWPQIGKVLLAKRQLRPQRPSQRSQEHCKWTYRPTSFLFFFFLSTAYPHFFLGIGSPQEKRVEYQPTILGNKLQSKKMVNFDLTFLSFSYIILSHEWHQIKKQTFYKHIFHI